MFFILAVVISYLLGSIPTGYLVSKKIKGIDIRRHGSGNIGFTNVLRVLGKGPASIVLAGDVSKGLAGTLLGHYLGSISGFVHETALLAGIAALVGHSFPVFLNFKGGKMAATGLGVLLALAPKEALIALVVWLLVLAISRYVSLSSIAAAVSVPISMFLFREDRLYIIFGLVAAAFLIIRHSSNISRLIKGTEYKIGQKAR